MQLGKERFCFTAAEGQAARHLKPFDWRLASHTSEPRPDRVMPRRAGRLEDGQPASAMANGTLAPLIGSLAAFDRQPRLRIGTAPRRTATGKLSAKHQ
jgi:hypothetical protein